MKPDREPDSFTEDIGEMAIVGPGITPRGNCARHPLRRRAPGKCQTCDALTERDTPRDE